MSTPKITFNNNYYVTIIYCLTSIILPLSSPFSITPGVKYSGYHLAYNLYPKQYQSSHPKSIPSLYSSSSPSNYNYKDTNKTTKKKPKPERLHDDNYEDDLTLDESNNYLLDSLQGEFNYKGRISTPIGSNDGEGQSVHRCGYVSIIGAPNMGKSTLLNALLQENLCVSTHRPQTTRHAILGILNSPSDIITSSSSSSTITEPYCQICFTDTPGVIQNPAYKLQEGMMEAVKSSFVDSDVVLVVTDLFSTPIPDDILFQKVQQVCETNQKPVIAAINKIDLVDRITHSSTVADNKNDNSEDNKQHQSQYHEIETSTEIQYYLRTVTVADAIINWRSLLPNALAIVPLQASAGHEDVGVQALKSLLIGGPDVPQSFRNLGRPYEGMFRTGVKFIENDEACQLLPIGPKLYDVDTLTDRNERFFASEIIRGVLFCQFGKELPYCCEVIINEFKEPKKGKDDENPIVRIKATIMVERDSQKGILIGKNGVKIKEVGIDARVKLEEFLQDKVYLELNVKVDKNWRRDEKKLKQYGYLK
jgi:GTP-binding protein Era